MAKKLTSGKGWVFVGKEKAHKAKVQSMAPEKQQIRIRLEKRSGGKQVTVVSHVVLSESDRKIWAKALKVHCGVGGTVKDDGMELQGDCQEKARLWLEKNNWRLKK